MKYFYSDPLAAAWMAKHFGMKFCKDNRKWIGSPKISWHFFKHFSKELKPPFYIHPDSLYLLEKQNKDLSVMLENPIITVQPLSELSEEDKSIRKFPKVTIQIGKIIQRNGIAFMWPEIEQ